MTTEKNLQTLPTADEFSVAKETAKYFIQSGMMPKHLTRPEQVLVIIMAGREMGLGPWASVQEINLIQGKPELSAKAHLAMVYKSNPNHQVEFVETSDERCIIKAKRSNEANFQTFTYTVDDAKAAGNLGKGNYGKYLRDMLRARCITQVVRSKFPDSCLAMGYEPSELGHANHRDDASEAGSSNESAHEPDDKPNAREVTPAPTTEPVVQTSPPDGPINQPLEVGGATKSPPPEPQVVTRKIGITDLVKEVEALKKYEEQVKNIPPAEFKMPYGRHAKKKLREIPMTELKQIYDIIKKMPQPDKVNLIIATKIGQLAGFPQ